MRRVIRVLLLVSVIALLLPGAVGAREDWPVPGGHFFTQTGGDGHSGYLVSDDDGVSFLSEFRRLGGVSAVGYPVSQRFLWHGFTSQAFQRVIFQWHPECHCAMFVNVFDLLNELGKDAWLLTVRQTPSPRNWDEAGKPWPEVVSGRLAVMDAYPAIKAKYYSVVGDPIQANGLPTSDVVDMGNHYALRAQRVVFQQWKEDVPWARKGDVTVALGGDIAKEAGLLPAGTLPPGASTTRQLFLAYYVPYDASSWASLEANARMIDYVGAQWVTIDACGSVGSRDNQTLNRFARANGVKVLPSLLTSSQWLNHRLLTDPAISARAVDQIVAYTVAEGYAGFDLDLEGVAAQDRAAYTAFVARLAAALHEQGKVLTLAIPAKTREVTTGWAGAYDYAALGRHADLITIMSYEYRGPWSTPGSIAPHSWVDDVVAYASSQIPPHKVAVGLAFYGYDWNVTTGTARSLRYPQAADLANRYQQPITLDTATQSATFGYRAAATDPPPTSLLAPPQGHDITERKPPPCSATPPPTSPTPTPQRTPTPTGVHEHVVWLEDSGSAAARLQLVGKHKIAGAAAWRLGQEDPRTWTVLREWKQIR